jgi:hypothetical protein
VEVPGSVDGKGEFENGVAPRSDAAVSTGASSPGSNVSTWLQFLQ